MADQSSGDPMDIRTACIAAHEYHTSLRAAGFANAEALYLVACILAGGPRPPTEETGDTPEPPANNNRNGDQQ